MGASATHNSGFGDLIPSAALPERRAHQPAGFGLKRVPVKQIRYCLLRRNMIAAPVGSRSHSISRRRRGIGQSQTFHLNFRGRRGIQADRDQPNAFTRDLLLVVECCARVRLTRMGRISGSP